MTARSPLASLVLALALAAPAVAQSPEEHEATFRAMVEAINARDLDALDELMTDDLVRHSQSTPGIQVKSLEDMKAFLRSDFAAVPDSEVECPMVIAEGDLVASWCTYRGTQEGRMGPFPPSGERMNLDFAGFLRFEDGRIAEMWTVWDNLTALTQLGHMPAPEALFEGQHP
ncbi:MAG: ester cyclase [Gemmatimonadota bacterium]|nr:ester cyclase [Gemmatimonadota bacterium]